MQKKSVLLKKFVFYFIIGSCISGTLIIVAFPFVMLAAAACARIATTNSSEKVFTKDFWLAVTTLITFWCMIYTMFWMK